MKQDLEHLRLLSIFHYVVGGLAALFASIPIIHLIVGIVFIVASAIPDADSHLPPASFGWFFVILASMMILVGWSIAACIIAAGRSLARRKHYTFCLVMAGIECLFMPFGTVLGVFTIVVLARDSVKELFTFNQGIRKRRIAMKRPTWAVVVGVLGIIFGCLGVLGAGQYMMMPTMLEFQKETFAAMEESFEEEATDSEQVPPEVFKQFQKMWDAPEWYGTWCLFAGAFSLIVSGFYIFASIRLLQTVPSAIKLFYTAVGLSIGVTFLKAVVAGSAMSFMGLAMMIGSMCSVVVHIVLAIVVATGNKEAFTVREASGTL